MALLPQGMSENDYEAIEAAVTETVRGRWFLNEFARRNRAGELRQILDAMTRLEGAVANGKAALPPADPSVRLLMQRVKARPGQRAAVAGEMRAAGADESFARAVTEQGRAVAGLLRGPVLPPKAASPAPMALPAKPDPAPESAPRPDPTLKPASSPEAAAPPRPAARPTEARPPPPDADPRLRILDELDRLPLAEKIALFA